MKKVNTQEYRASRRGFSLVEVVVGMVLIIMVSGASIFLVMQHSAAERTVLWTVEATNIAENAIECFHAASDAPGNTFEDLFFGGVYGSDYENLPGYVHNDYDPIHTYKYNHQGLGVTIEINTNTISIEVQSPDRKAILTHDQTTYRK